MNTSAPLDCAGLRQLVGGFSLVESCDVIANGMIRLSTPFRYPDGSAIDLFLTPQPDAAHQLTLTDLGHTTAYLLDMQVKPWTTKKRFKQIQDICQSLAVTRDGGELKIILDVGDAPQVASMLVRLGQACLRMADMALTQRLPTADTFGETLEEFVTEIDRPYEAGIEIIGRYHKPVPVDYRVTGRTTSTLVQTLSTANSAAAHGLSTEIFTRWYDLEPVKPQHQFVTIFDTTNNAVRDQDIKRLRDVSLVFGYPVEAKQISDVLVA